ncbi:hypothetical protein M8J77_000560 [Diaphorina citri]|nr:hypothetical protein M8J77_000560 [Diaphorina citri]
MLDEINHHLNIYPATEKRTDMISNTGCVMLETNVAQQLKKWHTREMAKSLNKSTYLGISLREAIIYLFFLLCLLIVACSMLNSWMYWYNHLITDLFIHTSFPAEYLVNKTYPRIITHQDFWQYTKTVLARNFWYDLYPDDILEDIPITERHTMRNVMYENKLIGLPRIRQLKVRNDSCEVHPDLTDLFRRCYDSFSEGYEDRRPFGIGSGTAWTYPRDSSVWDSDYYTGQVGSYPYSGFYQDLSANHNDFLAQLDMLRKGGWITRATRVVFIDFSMYNANVNLFCFVKLILEWPPVGGIIPSWEIISLKLIRYLTLVDFILLVFEIILLLFLIYFTVEELYEYRNLGFYKYFNSFWNYVDLILIVLGWLFVIVYIYRLILVQLLLTSLIQTKYRFAKFHRLVWAEQCLNILMVLIVFVAWIKLFKYLNVTRNTSHVYRTVAIALIQLLTVIILFIIMLVGFAICGYLLFGSYIGGFSSLLRSCVTLIRCTLGDCTDLAYDTDLIRCIYFCLFVLGVVIFGGLVLAILLDAYLSSKYQEKSYDNYASYLRTRWSKLDAYLRRKSHDDQVENPKHMNYDNISGLLKRSNFTQSDISLFTRKFHLGPNTQLDESGVENLISNIEKEVSLREDMAYSENHSSRELEQRVSLIEDNITSIDSKIDDIISRISHLQNRISRLE